MTIHQQMIQKIALHNQLERGEIPHGIAIARDEEPVRLKKGRGSREKEYVSESKR